MGAVVCTDCQLGRSRIAQERQLWAYLGREECLDRVKWGRDEPHHVMSQSLGQNREEKES